MVPAAATRPSVAPTRARTTETAWSPETIAAMSGAEVMKARSGG
jgi:hypothetical protein